MEINKQIFGERTPDQIALPTCKVRIIKGIKQVHYYTFEEYKKFFAIGVLEVIDDTEWLDCGPVKKVTTENKEPDENGQDN